MFIPLHQLNGRALAGRQALSHWTSASLPSYKKSYKNHPQNRSDAGHMAASLTRTNCTSSQLPALLGSILFCCRFFLL